MLFSELCFYNRFLFFRKSGVIVVSSSIAVKILKNEIAAKILSILITHILWKNLYSQSQANKYFVTQIIVLFKFPLCYL